MSGDTAEIARNSEFFRRFLHLFNSDLHSLAYIQDKIFFDTFIISKINFILLYVGPIGWATENTDFISAEG